MTEVSSQPPEPGQSHGARKLHRVVAFWVGQWMLNNTLLVLTILGIVWTMVRIYRVSTTVNQMSRVLVHAPEQFKEQTEATLERLHAAHLQVIETARRSYEARLKVDALAKELDQASSDTLSKLDVPAMQKQLAAAAEAARVIADSSTKANATVDAALRAVPTIEAQLAAAGKQSGDAAANVNRDLSLAANAAHDLSDRLDHASASLQGSLAAVPTIEARMAASARRVADADAALQDSLASLPAAPKAGATAAASLRSTMNTAVGLQASLDTQAAAVQKQLSDLRGILTNATTEANALLTEARALHQEISRARSYLHKEPSADPSAAPTP